MAKLELQIIGFNETLSNMTINGKQLKINSIYNGVRTSVIETKKDYAEIVVYKNHYYSSNAWFLINLFYFFISLFGIFDIRHDKKCTVIDCRYVLKLTELTKATIRLNQFTDGGRFIELKSSNPVKEIQNIQYYDTLAQKRYKRMKLVKLAIFFAAMITTILLLVL